MNASKAQIYPDNADARVGNTAKTPDVMIKIRVSGEGKDGYTPRRGVDYWTEEDQQSIRDYVDEAVGDAGGGGGGMTELPVASADKLGGVMVGKNLAIDENGRLSVDTTDGVSEDNTRPITSAGVYVVVGNIEALLKTI